MDMTIKLSAFIALTEKLQQEVSCCATVREDELFDRIKMRIRSAKLLSKLTTAKKDVVSIGDTFQIRKIQRNLQYLTYVSIVRLSENGDLLELVPTISLDSTPLRSWEGSVIYMKLSKIKELSFY